MPLTPFSIKRLIEANTPGKFSDSGGMFIRITPNGSALWQLKYRFEGKEKLASLGRFPEVGLADARESRDKFKAELKTGVDPLAKERRAKTEQLTFGWFAEQILAHEEPQQKAMTRKKWKLHMAYATDRFGKRPIADITAAEVLAFLLEFQDKGTDHTAHSIKQKMAAVFRRAAVAGICAGDPTVVLKGMLRPARDTSHPAITDPKRFGELLRAIWAYRGDVSTRCALKFIALTFQRPHMIREMRWADVDTDAALWSLTAAQMKGTEELARDHLVPLSKQALAVLEEIRPITGEGELVFPGRAWRGPEDVEPSVNTMNRALKLMGFTDHVAHGFRASANTMLLERLHIEQKIIDLQLAHVEPNKVRRAYDRSAFLEQRVAMLGRWGDWCDLLRKGGDVVRLGTAAPKRAKKATSGEVIPAN